MKLLSLLVGAVLLVKWLGARQEKITSGQTSRSIAEDNIPMIIFVRLLLVATIVTLLTAILANKPFSNVELVLFFCPFWLVILFVLIEIKTCIFGFVRTGAGAYISRLLMMCGAIVAFYVDVYIDTHL